MTISNTDEKVITGHLAALQGSFGYYEEVSTFEVADRVFHYEFGKGIVTDLKLHGKDIVLDIYFQSDRSNRKIVGITPLIIGTSPLMKYE